MKNPNLLYTYRRATPERLWLFRGSLSCDYESDGVVRGYIEVVSPSDARCDIRIPYGVLLCIPTQYEPERLLTKEDQETLVRICIADEQFTDWWFTQQTDINIIKAYRRGYDAQGNEGSRAIVANPIIPGDADQNLLHFAWQRGRDRYTNMLYWQQQREAWRNPQ